MAKDISLRVSSPKISMKCCYRLIIVLVMLNILMNHNSWLPESVAQTVVNFPDANLAAAVRAGLGLGATDPITDTDLERLTALVANRAGIRNLTGLEKATNLQVLGLRENQISNIGVLSDLTALT